MYLRKRILRKVSKIKRTRKNLVTEDERRSTKGSKKQEGVQDLESRLYKNESFLVNINMITERRRRNVRRN